MTDILWHRLQLFSVKRTFTLRTTSLMNSMSIRGTTPNQVMPSTLMTQPPFNWSSGSNGTTTGDTTALIGTSEWQRQQSFSRVPLCMTTLSATLLWPWFSGSSWCWFFKPRSYLLFISPTTSAASRAGTVANATVSGACQTPKPLETKNVILITSFKLENIKFW